MAPLPKSEAAPGQPKGGRCGFAYREFDGQDHWNCERCAIGHFVREDAAKAVCKLTGEPVEAARLKKT